MDLTRDYKIKSVQIKNLWHEVDINATLNEGLNIVVGFNGSFKTTFINLIAATLRVDTKILSEIYFDYIEIDLVNDKNTHNIKVLKNRSKENPDIEYSIDNEFPCLVCSGAFNNTDNPTVPFLNSYRSTIGKFSQWFNISWLPLDRNQRFRNDAFYDNTNLPDDYIIDNLTRRFTNHKLNIESRLNKLNNRFISHIFPLTISPLISLHKERQVINYDDINLDEFKIKLNKAFSIAGVEEEYKEQIDSLFLQLSNRLIKLQEGKLSTNDVFFMGSLISIYSIAKEFDKVEARKDKIKKPLEDFNAVLHSFLGEKYGDLSENSRAIELKNQQGEQNFINLKSLSSGEKQILIFLMEMMLSNQQPVIFIADEPELSLHVEWQRLIINAIATLNPNAQVIIATHSPSIIASSRKSVIQMNKITSNVQL